MITQRLNTCHAFISPVVGSPCLTSQIGHRPLLVSTSRRPRVSTLTQCVARQTTERAQAETATTQSAGTITTSPVTAGESSLLSTFARGETFSRRTIGLYELKREGVDPTVLLKRGFGFEAVFAGTILVFTSTLFFIPLATHTPVREDIVGGIAALLMGAWAIDTLALNAAFSTAAVAALSNRMRVARHEAAHLLVAHLLGFRVSAVTLPFPKAVFQAARSVAPPPGVALDRSLAQGDAHRVAAVGLAGLAAELLVYRSAKGAADDMAQVSRRVRSALADQNPSDEDVKHVVRWGLLVATRIVKQHCDAYTAIVKALLDGKDASHCVRLIDELADKEHLVDEPFGSL